MKYSMNFGLVLTLAVWLAACGSSDFPGKIDATSPCMALDLTQTSLPNIELLSPQPDFVEGSALQPDQLPAGAQSVQVFGYVHVADNAADPVVTVNGVDARMQMIPVQAGSASADGQLCYAFTTELNMNKGAQQVSVSVVDGQGGSASQSVAGHVDYCVIGDREPGVLSAIQDDPNIAQGNRCHEIDGCSAYIAESDPLAKSGFRNDPTAGTGNSLAHASTAFGSGETLNMEYFIHGQHPKDNLACNHHDVCYQTMNSDKANCDDTMHSEMLATCELAYPAGSCTDTTLECTNFALQKASCTGFAKTYYEALGSLGGNAFDQRRTEYGPN